MLHSNIFFTSLFFNLALLAVPVKTENSISNLPVRWIVEKTSTLRVSGKSNVNEFTCEVNGYYGTDTISCEDLGNGKTVRLNGSLEIDVFKFDCHNGMITKDLQKTLKMATYPKMTIRFLWIDHLPSFTGSRELINGCVLVELAGCGKCFQFPYEFTRKGTDSFLLNGRKTFSFSEFNLQPPQKLAGMIKVKDQFVVEFQLNIKNIK